MPGHSARLQAQADQSPSLAPLWCKPGGYLVHNVPSSLEMLHAEIIDFVAHLSPDADEKRWRQAVTLLVVNRLTSFRPEAKVGLFGSSATGLYLSTSDIDLVVEGCENGVGELYRLAGSFEAEGWEAQVVPAKTPLLKLGGRKTGGLVVDVCLAAPGCLENAAFVRRAAAEFPELRPMVLFLKYLLRERGLNTAFTGGLSSHALTMFVIAYLQYMSPRPASKSEPTPPSPLVPVANLGQRIISFLDLYGRDFDSANFAISVLEGGPYLARKLCGWASTQDPLAFALEDPHSRLDIGASCFNHLAVRLAFLSAANALRDVIATSVARACRGTPVRLSMLSAMVYPVVYRTAHAQRVLARAAGVAALKEARNAARAKRAMMASCTLAAGEAVPAAAAAGPSSDLTGQEHALGATAVHGDESRASPVAAPSPSASSSELSAVSGSELGSSNELGGVCDAADGVSCATRELADSSVPCGSGSENVSADVPVSNATVAAAAAAAAACASCENTAAPASCAGAAASAPEPASVDCPSSPTAESCPPSPSSLGLPTVSLTLSVDACGDSADSPALSPCGARDADLCSTLTHVHVHELTGSTSERSDDSFASSPSVISETSLSSSGGASQLGQKRRSQAVVRFGPW